MNLSNRQAGGEKNNWVHINYLVHIYNTNLFSGGETGRMEQSKTSLAYLSVSIHTYRPTAIYWIAQSTRIQRCIQVNKKVETLSPHIIIMRKDFI